MSERPGNHDDTFNIMRHNHQKVKCVPDADMACCHTQVCKPALTSLPETEDANDHWSLEHHGQQSTPRVPDVTRGVTLSNTDHLLISLATDKQQIKPELQDF